MDIVKDNSFLERRFKLKENNTDVKTEILAGLTTFMTMAYILIVNPGMLNETGMNWGGVFTATALSSAIATLLMAFLANYPFALAPGMGLNAFFTYSVVLGMSKSWQFALTAVFIEGIIFIILSLFKVREAIFNIIPSQATAPALVLVGLFMMSPIKEIDLEDFTEAIPAFLTIVMMPFAYSIAEGIVFGMVSYVILKLITGKWRDVSVVMYILAFLFILKEILPLITR